MRWRRSVPRLRRLADLAGQVRLFAADAAAGFLRNGLMTAAAVTTIMVALLVVGVAVLIGVNLSKVAVTVEQQVEVVAFLREGLPPSRVAEVERTAADLPGVRSVQFVGRDAALRRLQLQMGETAAFADLASSNPLPDSIELRLDDAGAATAVASTLARQPGIAEVTYGGQVVDRLIALTRGIRAVALLLTLFLAAVALVVVVNTLRLTVIARRQEIEIMQLVGATRWFIRWPFLIEGVFQGGSASAGALLTLGLLYAVGLLRLRESMPFLPVAGPGEVALPLLVSVLAGGLLVGVAGSLIAVRRFLTS